MARKCESQAKSLLKNKTKTTRLSQQNKSLNLKLKAFKGTDHKTMGRLTSKLQSMGVDVGSLLNPQESKQVTFTFVGPAGLIEGGSNQSIPLAVDVESLLNVE